MRPLRFDQWPAVKPVIGMLHLLPLPGAPNARGSLAEVLARALADAEALAMGGCHALMLENFGDVPFYPDRVPAVTVAAMTRVAAAVKERFASLPLGINVLRNDGLSALAVAVAAGADFVRVNVLTGARVTDQGLVQGIAHDLARARQILSARHVAILGDVDVKHSAPLAARPLADEVADTVHRGLADAVVVSGSGTGQPVDPAKLRSVKTAAGASPVLLGSGVTAQTLATLAPHADGFIVGTALKEGGLATNAVSRAAVEALMAAHKAVMGGSRP